MNSFDKPVGTIVFIFMIILFLVGLKTGNFKNLRDLNIAFCIVFVFSIYGLFVNFIGYDTINSTEFIKTLSPIVGFIDFIGAIVLLVGGSARQDLFMIGGGILMFAPVLSGQINVNPSGAILMSYFAASVGLAKIFSEREWKKPFQD